MARLKLQKAIKSDASSFLSSVIIINYIDIAQIIARPRSFRTRLLSRSLPPFFFIEIVVKSLFASD
jgi:hypothetical protein